MKHRPMRYLYTLALPAMALSFASCRLVALDYDTPPLEQLEVGASEISNWKPQAAMKVFIGDKLYDLNDGGAPQYLDKGCKKTGDEKMDGPNGLQMDMWIMDFGKDINAMAMFTEMQLNNVGQGVNDPAFPQIPDTTTLIVPNMGGVTGYAHFANYYFELKLTGFSDQELAIQTFDMFIRLFRTKLNM